MFLQMELVQLHVLTGTFITTLEAIRERKEQATLEAYLKCAKKKTDPLENQRSQNNSSLARRSKALREPTPMCKGAPLPPVKFVNNGQKPELDPKTCLHPAADLSHPRGGQNGFKWFTCLKCGARWERVWESQVPDEKTKAKNAVTTIQSPSGEPTNQNRPRARGQSAMTAPEESAMSGSARSPRAAEWPEKLPLESQMTSQAQLATLEDQLAMNYQFLVGNLHMTREEAIQTLLNRAQNEVESEAIKKHAGL